MRVPSGTTTVFVRRAFVAALAAIYLVAFVSLASQIDWLIGSQGLLPAATWLGEQRGGVSFWQAPSIFWLGASDPALRLAAVSGAALSLALLLGVYPRFCLLALWALYLSFVSVGQTFFAFQWDNLLLETTLLACFVAPWSRAGFGRAPHPAAVFLLQWLLVRLHVESGLAKLLSGDPSWRNLTALITYYETAPLPTSLGWVAHQLPPVAHRLSALGTLVIEILLPWGIWAPRSLRRVAIGCLALLQVLVLATANYGFFNYLTLALCLWGLDDEDVRQLSRWCGANLPGRAQWQQQNQRPRARAPWVWLMAGLWALVSLVPFSPFVPPLRGAFPRLQGWLATWRAANAYHLFASMTYVRYEPVIEGSDDTLTWLPYEFRYKPGDVFRPPSWVAPHQPRVDFQLWFLLLRGRAPRDRYFHNLVVRLLTNPQALEGLFARDPFLGRPPHWLRLVVYRYRFTDWATVWKTGAWWQREWIATYGPVTARDVSQ
ncbi:MAG: lipase maturation factor family protein [Candidatus Binatia bacterium]|nr:lipase maturation factor family protein [Candidatus Binatia bacterium]